MKKVFMAMFLLLAMALLLAGCGKNQAAVDGTVQLSPLLLEQPAEYYQGYTVQEINAAMFVYDCYYLGENDWLVYASVGFAQGSDRLLFRLKDGAARLVYQQMTPEDEWLFYSSYLPQYGKCALYNQIKQQFVFYDVQSGDVEQVKMPQELGLSEKDRVIWLGGEQYLLGRSMANERLRLSLYDKAGAEEQFLAELNGGWLRECGQTSTGLWPLLTDAGDLCVLKLTADGAETVVYHCAQEWPAAAEFISYNNVLAVPGAESERVLLTIYCDDETVYQVIDLAANKEIGRHVVSNHIGEARYANDIKLLGCYGDKMFFPIYYHYNSQKPDKYYGQVWSYDYLSGDWELVYNSWTAKNPYYFYFGGTVSPDGSELMLSGRYYTMRLPLADCGDSDTTPGEGVSVYEYWIAEEFGEDIKPDENGAYWTEKQMALYDAYYLAPQDWLLFAVTIVPDGCRYQLFRLTGTELQWLCSWPEDDYFSFDEYASASVYLPEQGICAMYNPYRQQYYFYDVAAKTGRQIQLPLPQNKYMGASEEAAVCLTDNLFLFWRRLPDERLSLSLYDLAADREKPLGEMNGGRIQNYYQLEPGLWLLMTNAGDMFELQLNADGAQLQNLHSCPEEWPPGEDWSNYNHMRPVPNTEGVRVVLFVFGEENKIYQVIDWENGVEIGRCLKPRITSPEYGMLYVDDVELLGAQGDFLYFPRYIVEDDNYYLHLMAYNYLTGAETELFNNRSQSKPRHTWFCKGVCSPDGRQLLIYNYMDMWSLPLAKIMAETELIK